MATGNAHKRGNNSPTDQLNGESATVVDMRTRSEAAHLACARSNRNDPYVLTLPDASEELAAAVRETCAAVNVIIDQAEAILDDNTQDASAYRAAVQGAMLRILEVCSFEDLTGQRIAKAADILRQLDPSESVSCERATAPALARNSSASRLDGPALNAPHMSQAEIDAIFPD